MQRPSGKRAMPIGHPCIYQYTSVQCTSPSLYQGVRRSVWDPETSRERVGDWGGPETVKRRVGVFGGRPDRALYLPTFSHLLIVNKLLSPPVFPALSVLSIFLLHPFPSPRLRARAVNSCLVAVAPEAAAARSRP